MKKKIIVIVLSLAFFLWISIHLQDPYEIIKSDRLQAPSFSHYFGTDYLGRDLFSRLVQGSINSLTIATFSLGIVVLVSLFLGGIAGVFGGIVDIGITTLTDIVVSVPSIILALVFTGFFANSLGTVILALSISWSGLYIRYVRNLVLNIKKEEYIVLAPLSGSVGGHTLLHHIFPNLLKELISLFFTDLGKIMLSISGLSFLGIGIQPPTPELGTILYDGKAYFFIAPWLFLFPGITLSIFMLITQYFSRKISTKRGNSL